MEKRWKKVLVLLLSFGLMLSGASMVLAQTDSKDKSEAFVLEEVVVTGSRIAREQGFGQTSPVTVMGKEDITSFGLTRIEDVLNTMPQVETGQTAFKSNGATGTASVDLRGLGSTRTLPLMNGRRLQPGGTDTVIPDINQIPSAMVERVEVLTGGASAVYGADAVAGVVNFIMRKVQGVELSFGIDGYQHNNNNGYMRKLMDEKNFKYPKGDTGLDGKSYNIDLIAGSDFADGKGNATFYASWRKNDELLEKARDYSSCALNSAGDSCGGSGNAIVPNLDITPHYPATEEDPAYYDWDQENYFTLQPDGSVAEYSGNLYNYAPVNHFQRPDQRYTAGGFIDLDVTDYAKVYGEIQFFNDHTRAQIAESGTFFAEAYDLSADNPLFPAAFLASLQETFSPGADGYEFWIGKRNVEGGPRVEIIDHTSWRAVGGVKGPINENWNYDVSYLKAQTTSSSVYKNDFMATKLATAVDGAACAADPDCVPYPVFTYEGISSAAAAAQSATAASSNVTSLQVISAVVNGDTGVGLSAGNINVAVGYEYRKETYNDIRDYVYEAGLLLGQGGPRPSLAGSFHVNELFGEADVPLLADVPGVKDLTLNLALRYTDHNMSGTSMTYRTGLDYSIDDMWRLRAGYNRAVRAPNIDELFSTAYVNLWSGSDPCAGATPSYSAAQCALTGVTASLYGKVPVSPASQYNWMVGGNRHLKPEEADTYTLGLVVEPMKSLKMSVDYWKISIDKTIGTIADQSGQIIIDLCATKGQLCDLIHRSPTNGNLWMGTGVYVENTTQNIGTQNWEGVDFAGAYWLDALEGTFNINMTGTLMLKKETTPNAADPSTAYDCVGDISTSCFPTPRWRHTASVTYDSQEFWSVMARWRYFSGVNYTEDVDQVIDLRPTSYLDLSADFKFLANSTFTIGINNVFDKEPYLVGDTMNLTYGNANSIAGYYDTLGRFIYARATLRF